MLKRLLYRFDGYLIGYPKAGNTWMQLMLRVAIVRYLGLGLDRINDVLGPRHSVPHLLPAVCVSHHMPRFHEETADEMRLDIRALRDKAVVLLIRNPGDTLVSLYMQNAHRAAYFGGTIDAHALSPIYGIDKYVKFYRRLYESRGEYSRLTIVSYEKLFADPVLQLRRALETFGMPDIGTAALQQAVEFCSFENMRTLEDTDALGFPPLKPSPTTSSDARKVRIGGVGGFRDRLASATQVAIHARMRDAFPPDLLAPIAWPAAEPVS